MLSKIARHTSKWATTSSNGLRCQDVACFIRSAQVLNSQRPEHEPSSYPANRHIRANLIYEPEISASSSTSRQQLSLAARITIQNVTGSTARRYITPAVHGIMKSRGIRSSPELFSVFCAQRSTKTQRSRSQRM